MVAFSSSRPVSEILVSRPSTRVSGSAPIVTSTGIPSASRPTSISSTVPRNSSSSISAIVIRTVPSWNVVSGTTGSPISTIFSRMKPWMGLWMTVSTASSPIVTRPSESRARRSRAIWSWSETSLSEYSASSNCSSDARSWSRNAASRSRRLSSCCNSISRSSMLRRASTSSIGVGLGWTSSRGSPCRTYWPGSLNIRRTTPASCDFTLTSTSGSMRPTASARSTISPLSTATASTSVSPLPAAASTANTEAPRPPTTIVPTTTFAPLLMRPVPPA